MKNITKIEQSILSREDPMIFFKMGVGVVLMHTILFNRGSGENPLSSGHFQCFSMLKNSAPFRESTCDYHNIYAGIL